MRCNQRWCIDCLNIWAGTLLEELTGFSRDHYIWWKVDPE
jgi:hypothetical protein